MKNTYKIVFFISFLFSLLSVNAERIPGTQRLYLSGHGCDDMVQWQFKCTGGRNSGNWTTIGVPSCWELQGFGILQYGMSFYGKKFPNGIADEKGIYKYEFTIPKSWVDKDVEIIFEGVMTDATSKINGRRCVKLHQGAFYRFGTNVTDRINIGRKNTLEVTVSKESANPSINMAERRADYWNFGGIFRPVFLEARPSLNIHKYRIEAKADGTFNAECFTNRAIEGGSVETKIINAKGRVVAKNNTSLRNSDHADIKFSVKNPELWTAETPNLYTVEFILKNAAGKALHEEKDKFGFRTIEVRKNDGLYINGTKVLVKGANRHSLRPESGRTLSRAKNIEDVELIKSLNMNAVRLSHYPPDPEFLYACDSLGLYVMDELCGWHYHSDTGVGTGNVKSMVERDENHPSVIWWSNGNEKGWNTELDKVFGEYDLQNRPVIHPQGNFGGFETMHYRSYGESEDYMRKPEIFMPTEFLHGLYDGGLGAGLYDYWELMRKDPKCAGGFLWALADQGVLRKDKNDIIDLCGNYGADGIVGPHFEKEGSYWTIKQIWCPVQIENVLSETGFDGNLTVENRYDFISLKGCKIKWEQVAVDHPEKNPEERIIKKGYTDCGNILPGKSGIVKIPVVAANSDYLRLTVIDSFGKELFTWSYPLKNHSYYTRKNKKVEGIPSYSETPKVLTVKTDKDIYVFSKENGQLLNVNYGSKTFDFSGPKVIAAKRGDRSMDQFYNHDDKDARKKERIYYPFDDKGVFEGFSVSKSGDTLVVVSNYKLGLMKKVVWKIRNNGKVHIDYSYTFNGVVDLMGVYFDYPESKVLAKTWIGNGPYRVWQNRIRGPQFGLWSNKYNDPIPGESFDYPEFKGYFANVAYMNIKTNDGIISLWNPEENNFVGVYQPRDGRDKILYALPNTGISILDVIPPVRNKVNTTDLIGPSSQPHRVYGENNGSVDLDFK